MSSILSSAMQPYLQYNGEVSALTSPISITIRPILTSAMQPYLQYNNKVSV